MRWVDEVRGLDGALVAVEFLARFDVAFCRLAPAGSTDLYSLPMGSTSRSMGLGKMPCACASTSLARLRDLSTIRSQSMLTRVDGGFGRWRQAFLSESVGWSDSTN